MNVFVLGASAVLGYIAASLMPSISHHAAAAVPVAKVPINVAYSPDTACGSVPQTGKPAITASINGIKFVAEIDSGAASAVMNPATANLVKLTTFPKGGLTTLSFTGQATNTFQGYNVPLVIPGLSPMTTTFFTGPQIGCNLIPTRVIEQTFVVGLGPNSVTFTHV